MPLEIIRPNPRYLNSYLEACRAAWGKVHDDYILHDPARFSEWKETIFDDYRNQEAGIGLRRGFVPSATFWLIRNNECAGSLNVRLQLNETLRRYGGNAGIFVRADRRRLGIMRESFTRLPELFSRLGLSDEILLTCYESNIPVVNCLDSMTELFPRRESDVVLLDGKPVKIRRYFS